MDDPTPQPAVAMGQAVETAPKPAAAFQSEATGSACPEGYDHVFDTSEGVGNGPRVINIGDKLEVVCGPLLNYKRLSTDEKGRTIWYGTVLIVTMPGQKQPTLQLRPKGPVSHHEETEVNGEVPTGQEMTIEGRKLFADLNKAFWRFSLEVPLERFEARWEYKIPRFHDYNGKPERESWNFVVPSLSQSMRIMFHSCNGFSVGTDLDIWQGPLLWNDVLRRHEQKPFHVMIGGGDQIYNDSVRVDGPLRGWTDIGNPAKRRAHPFPNSMREACDNFYFDNYVEWYATEPFATANAQIAQINIWDDHDIIDGFGSYTDHFMKCSVFRGIGGVSFKYYCLFQHHNAPPMSTYTTDAPATMKAINGTAGQDPRQLEHCYVYQEKEDDPSWIMGTRPGPYVEEKSRNIYTKLGKRIAFIGIDGRTERTRHQVNYPETYDLIFNRLEKELAESDGEIKHVIVLLGVPIAYPRLAWLENIFSSPIIAPIRLLNRRFGLGGSFFNKFDGQVDLLDDLDDHYTARHHKRERKLFIQRLQQVSQRFSVRVTILGGDVHLAAIGRFYSKLSNKIPAVNDSRYMVNVVSSAITNKPPPKAVANLLARRNKIHHLDYDTDETLMKIFDSQPGGKEKSADFNKVTMPSRNYACITEIDIVGASDGAGTDEQELAQFSLPKDGHFPLHPGEVNAGTKHPAANGITDTVGMNGGLDVSIRVEIDPADKEGNTEGYGFWIPPLIARQTEKRHPHEQQPQPQEEQTAA
ncbi:hypothetical protein PRK78_001103 [Emydomyces testavorans]|uniref:PhoD-like phosphatase domain-containing protein n=1 Tax=Emydomyces testavorans TaxID=2070801 RepID=A0AAF0DCT5_9EURO|nr:hypothetical protein PRK78_001103 [Emydomyces testavorans]